LYTAKLIPAKLLQIYRRIRYSQRRKSQSTPCNDCDSWTTFGNFSSDSINQSPRLTLPTVTANFSVSQPSQVWHPSMGSRLAWSFTSEHGPMSQAHYELSNAMTVEAPRTVLGGVTRALRRVSSS
jgi:hypothetical protein